MENKEIVIEVPKNGNKGKAPKPLKFIVNENGCWINTSHQLHHSGYHYMHYDGKKIGVHRFMYMLHKGDIPEDMLIRHTCDTPRCGNPEHLLLGTPRLNVNDKLERKRGYVYIIQEDIQGNEIARYTNWEELIEQRYVKKEIKNVIAGKYKTYRDCVWRLE